MTNDSAGAGSVQSADAVLDRAKELIDDFCEEQYGESGDYDDLSKVAILSTTLDEDDMPLQVYVNLVDFSLDSYINNVLVERIRYDSLDDLTESELAHLTSEELMFFSDEQYDMARRGESLEMVEGLNAQVLSRMTAEQDKYRAWLLSLPPEQILQHTYEYTVRQDILVEMEALNLSGEQARALLNSQSLLDDVYKAFRNIDTEYMSLIRDSIEDRARIEMQREREQRDALRKTPLYNYPGDYARENGELDAYRASHKANIACKEAIERAITDHYANNRLDGAAVKQVVNAFGYDRMLYVLANTVRQMNHDGRISNENKLWAATIAVHPDMNGFGSDRNAAFAVNKHPGLINIFVREARHQYLLSLPLTNEEIKAQAQSILSQYQNLREPNSPNGTHYVSPLSRDFLLRATDKDRERLMAMLPFRSLALTTLDGHQGVFAVISQNENRFQELRLRKPSIRAQLAAAASEQRDTPRDKQKDRGTR